MLDNDHSGKRCLKNAREGTPGIHTNIVNYRPNRPRSQLSGNPRKLFDKLDGRRTPLWSQIVTMII